MTLATPALAAGSTLPQSPHRVQLSRRAGWRMPENTVKVSRPSRWGNPYRIGDRVTVTAFGTGDVVQTIAYLHPWQAVDLYRLWIMSQLLEVPADLTGKNLACWCPLDRPCHADVLLAIANPGWAPPA
jgi:hypothetical protein